MKISVCIATYNGGKYIKVQLLSILKQLSRTDEVVISDDNSTDDTLKIIKELEDKRIKIYYSDKKSPIFNFENALLKCNGDIIFLSDQDDIWHTNKVKVMLAYMEKYNCVISDAEIINANDKIIDESFYKTNNSKSGLLMNLVSNSYLGCAMCFDRKVLEHSLPFPKDIEMHDRWIGLVSEIYGKTHFCNEKLFQYRRHENNFSMASEKSKNSLLKKLSIRAILVKNLLKRYFLNL